MSSPEADVYLSAVETIQQVSDVSQNLGIPLDKLNAILRGFEEKGLTLLSPDKKSFLSLATKLPISAQSIIG
jgi:hypothetical protein